MSDPRETLRPETTPDDQEHLALRTEIAAYAYTIWRNNEFIRQDEWDRVNREDWKNAEEELPKKVIEALRIRKGGIALQDIRVVLNTLGEKQQLIMTVPIPGREVPVFAFVSSERLEAVDPNFRELLMPPTSPQD